MPRSNRHLLGARIVIGLWLWLWLCWAVGAQPLSAIPEPGLILYGTITNTVFGEGHRLVQGNLQWTIQPAAGGPAITLTAALRNINDQFSYVLEVPFETRTVGELSLAPTANTLELKSATLVFDRATITIDGQPARLTTAQQGTFDFGPGDRGRQDRVDLAVSLAAPDLDGDGMADSWENAFFGSLTRNGAGDFDADGLSDYAEFRAGTDPLNPGSVFKFIDIGKDAQGGAGSALVQCGWPGLHGGALGFYSGRIRALADGYRRHAGRQHLRGRGSAGTGSVFLSTERQPLIRLDAQGYLTIGIHLMNPKTGLAGSSLHVKLHETRSWRAPASAGQVQFQRKPFMRWLPVSQSS